MCVRVCVCVCVCMYEINSLSDTWFENIFFPFHRLLFYSVGCFPDCAEVLGPLSYSTHKSQLKWIEDLNIGPEVVKVLKENAGEKLHDFGLGSDVTDVTPRAEATGAKLGVWDHVRPWLEFVFCLLQGWCSVLFHISFCP
uniref:Uncharacterized protein n=1 Tax=Molossus molossus TaxID=27622 RepID=A0A7J8JWL9_MOLMO|nr:hypothetical protein HJG59_007895 [Molossus molossus]